MEGSVATKAPPEPAPSHDGVAEATRSTEELFQWSGFVHVGVGAEECEHRFDGQCDQEPARVNPQTGKLVGHFHAWVCLPNAYQIRDIQEKARAARARKVRALRDPESDSGAILEAELDELRREHMDELLEAIASRTVDADLFDIVREVQDRDEFENHAADAEEYQRLSAIEAEERSEDEREDYERLQEQMLRYGQTMDDIIKARREGQLTRLRERSADDVIAMEREHRIKEAGDETFLFNYYTWLIYIGTRVPTEQGFPTKRKFSEAREQREAAPEIVVALRNKIRELEQATTVERRGDAAGNS